jgi:ribosomal protein L11 methyltransferase
LTALFPAAMQPEILSAELSKLISASELNYSRINDTDWQTVWQQQLKPQQFGERLWVLPHDYKDPAANSAVVRLEPGLAFGTGEHPTTAMCLEWLEATIKDGDTVLDYGCGSGLLGLAALALGAASVAATDIDNQALDATLNNAKNNGCAERLKASLPELMEHSCQYDVLVANILSGTLIELSPIIRPMMRPGARLAISGILAEQAAEVAAAWSDWADMQLQKQDGNWVLLSGSRLANETENGC